MPDGNYLHAHKMDGYDLDHHYDRELERRTTALIRRRQHMENEDGAEDLLPKVLELCRSTGCRNEGYNFFEFVPAGSNVENGPLFRLRRFNGSDNDDYNVCKCFYTKCSPCYTPMGEHFRVTSSFADISHEGDRLRVFQDSGNDGTFLIEHIEDEAHGANESDPLFNFGLEQQIKIEFA